MGGGAPHRPGMRRMEGQHWGQVGFFRCVCAHVCVCVYVCVLLFTWLVYVCMCLCLCLTSYLACVCVCVCAIHMCYSSCMVSVCAMVAFERYFASQKHLHADIEAIPCIN